MEDVIIEVRGATNLVGKEIPNVVGGFGEGKKSITDKHIAELHGMLTKNVRARITDNIKRFKEGVDYIDLKIVAYQTSDNLEVVHSMDYNLNCCRSERQQFKDSNETTNNLDLLLSLGYSKMEIAKAEHIYLLSERGYSKLIKIMDTDLAWEIHDKLIDEYFTMRELINSKQQLIATTFYNSIFAPTQEERTLNTKLFGELKEEYGREEQKKLDEQLLIQERTENYLSTVDLIKNLEMKNTFTKCLFRALESLGYGVNEVVNKNTKFIHNMKFENDFIKKGLCRCSATNRYTWNIEMINYIKENTNGILDLIKYHSGIISQEVEKNKERSKSQGFTLQQTILMLGGDSSKNTFSVFKDYLYEIGWLENEKVSQYAKENDYAYMYYKVIRIKEKGIKKLKEIIDKR